MIGTSLVLTGVPTPSTACTSGCFIWLVEVQSAAPQVAISVRYCCSASSIAEDHDHGQSVDLIRRVDLTTQSRRCQLTLCCVCNGEREIAQQAARFETAQSTLGSVHCYPRYHTRLLAIMSEITSIELEALTFTYGEEALTVLQQDPLSITISIAPHTGEVTSEQYVNATLRVSVSPKYPEEAPLTQLLNPQGER